MALSLNGTTGISGVDGSSSAPAVKGSDSNTGINFGTDEVNINTGGTTRATVTSNGRLSLTQNVIFPNKDGYIYSYNGGSDGQVRSGFELSGTNQTIRYFTATNERMRITSDGNVGINQTNPQAKFNVTVGNNVNFQVSNTNARVERSFSGGSNLDNDGMWFVDNDSTSGTYIRFW